MPVGLEMVRSNDREDGVVESECAGVALVVWEC